MKASFRKELPVLAAIFFFWFSMYTYPSFFSAYVSDRLMAPEVMTGLIVGAYGFAQMVLPIPLGIASDWTRRTAGRPCRRSAQSLRCRASKRRDFFHIWRWSMTKKMTNSIICSRKLPIS